VKKLKLAWCADLHTLIARLPPSVAALLLQSFAVLLALLSLRITGLHLDPLTFAFFSGALAAALSHFAGLARWWLPIQLLFAPAAVLTLTLHIPSGIYLFAFLIMLLVYWSTFRSQVPLYLSSKKVWQTLEELLPPAQANKTFTFMDIGSGMGGVLTHLAAARPDGLYFGVENAPLPYLLSRLRIKIGKYTNCQVLWGSMWECDLAQYDVVFAYLSPVPMEQLWHKVKQEMRPGSLFISNSFVVLEHPPQYSITLDDLHHSTLHIWHM
jgi:precorrin-6B methylase 2